MRDPKYVNLLDPKSGLFEPHPLNPLTKNKTKQNKTKQKTFLTHFVTESGPLADLGGGGASRHQHPWLRVCLYLHDFTTKRRKDNYLYTY